MLQSSKPVTNIQKLISQRMVLSKQTKPCFYLSLKADVTELMSLRPKLRKKFGVKITTNAFYISALSKAAQVYPIMLGKYENTYLKIPDGINVGFAVNAPQGLVVPVIRDANNKTLSQIAQLEQVLTEKARDNKLTLDDIEGETIALSNLGAFDVDSFLGIVPPPASTILSVGYVIPTVISKNRRPEVGKLVSLSLAVDHKVINGDYAAQFLSFIKEQLQNPEQLL